MSRTTLEVPADDAISLTLSKFRPEDLLNVIQGLKKVTDQDQSQARAMLEANPDLTYAVLQAQFLMGMVDEEVVMEAMKTSDSSAANGGMGDFAAGRPEETPSTSEPTRSETSSEPATSEPAAGPSTIASPKETPPDPFAQLPPEQAAMIRQVVGVSEEQLALLPKEQQEQVRALKQQFGL